ncbi:protein shisa-4 [Gastrophryne carolinensis]
MRMAAKLLGAAWLFLQATAPLVSAGEDCLWHQDQSGGWHPEFDCHFGTFCCGDCHQRYCCYDLSKLFTERMQKGCLYFSPKTIAGIGFAVLLFFVVIITLICCFMCSCCYLYQRRQQRSTPYRAQEIQMAGVSQQPLYPTQPSYPSQPPYPMQPPYPPQPPYAPQPGYEPVPMYPPTAQYPVYPPAPPAYTPDVTGPPLNTMIYDRK